MNFVRVYLSHELQHFQKLSTDARRLLLSILLFSLAGPILSTFVNAFLWRESQSIFLVVLYNFASFIGLPIGFYVNGMLMKRYGTTSLYFFGCLTQGLIVNGLMILPVLHVAIIFAFGILMGISGGFFWGNRQLLSMLSIKSSQRVYFSSIASMIGIITGIIVPFFVGWFIIFGESINLYAPKTAYQLLGVILLCLLYFSGLAVRRLAIERPSTQATWLKRPSERWKQLRSTVFLLGFSQSIEIALPAVMVLTLVGNEDSLGSIQAISGILLSISLYQIAKKVNKDFRLFILGSGVILSISAAFFFTYHFSAFGVICYFILNAFATSFRWTMVGPVSYDVIDREEKKVFRSRYIYIFDQELFLNLGRMSSICLFFLLYYMNSYLAVRFSPLFFALPQLSIFWLMASVEKELIREYILEKAVQYNYVRAVYFEEQNYDTR